MDAVSSTYYQAELFLVLFGNCVNRGGEERLCFGGARRLQRPAAVGAFNFPFALA
jgi:hypothetical protein